MADDLKAARNMDNITVHNAVVPFIQIWDSKSIVGVNAEWAHDLMGLDHERLTFFSGGRNMRLTDVEGEVIHNVLA